jgi:hypothetical protein
MAFFEYRTTDRVEMAFSMAAPQISVERMKAAEVVLMVVLMNTPMLLSIESSLHEQVRAQIQVIMTLLTRMQTFSNSREKPLQTIDVFVELHKLRAAKQRP